MMRIAMLNGLGAVCGRERVMAVAMSNGFHAVRIHERMMAVAMPNGFHAVRVHERMMAVAVPNRFHAVGFQERMNSPLERHEVRLRGLGGRAVYGVPCIGASAAKWNGRGRPAFVVGGGR